MAGIAEKLYPPTISGSVPAFYEENGTAVIAVPFAMNRAVSITDITSFSLKIKTAQSNTYITTLESDASETESYISNRIVKFRWSVNANWPLKVGQYIKVQLAYNAGGTVGYFSTVATTKYTIKPEVYIEDAVLEDNVMGIPSFKQSYVGVYKNTGDKSERPYAYNFYLYNRYKQLVEESGWQLHNTNINNSIAETLYPEKTTDTYRFKSTLLYDSEYYIQYGVKTINNLEVFSPMYACIDAETIDTNLAVNLIAENIFEEGYVNISLQLKSGYSLNKKDFYFRTRDTEINNEKNYYIYNIDNDEFILVLALLVEDLSTYYEVNNALQKPSLEKPISLEISRAEVGYGDTSSIAALSAYTWNTLKKVYFTNYQDMIDWSFKDFTIEQGIRYVYCFRQYNANGVYSNRFPSGIIYNLDGTLNKIEPVEADFEDMFLWDGKKQLKIRFNPKVSSFKATRLEQKLDTIGSRYPFIFRNGVVNYKEFPIGGLISYLADNNELFVNHEEDLNIILGSNARRDDGTPSAQTDWKTTQTLDSLGYNMRAERRFKMKLLEWLNNGEIKLFKSAAEGNFLVRIMNVSLTPEDKLGRMIHSFTANAYEVEELTYDNLVNLGFISLTAESEEIIGQRSIKIIDYIYELAGITAATENAVITKVFKLNQYPIINYLNITKAQNNNANIIIRIGSDADENKTIISTEQMVFDNSGYTLPDLYLNYHDYQSGLTYSELKTILGDTILTYRYSSTEVKVGDFLNITEVYVTNTIESFVGPGTFNLSSNIVTDGIITIDKQLINIYTLDFKAKSISSVYQNNNEYFDSIDYINRISKFDQSALYRIYSTVDNFTLCYVDAANNLIQIFIDETPVTNLNYNEALPQLKKIILTNQNGSIEYNEIPLINLQNQYFTSITLGAMYYVNCAFLQKVTKYESGGIIHD